MSDSVKFMLNLVQQETRISGWPDITDKETADQYVATNKAAGAKYVLRSSKCLCHNSFKIMQSIPTIATLLQMETSEIFLARTGHLQSEHGDVGLFDRGLQCREGCRRARSTPCILRRKESYAEAY